MWNGLDVKWKSTKPIEPGHNIAIVQFEVNRLGEIEHLRLQISTGKAVLDQSAISAVRKSAPYKELPEKFLEHPITAKFEFSV